MATIELLFFNLPISAQVPSPTSLFQVNSTSSNVYIQFPVNNTAIASTDCDVAGEMGRTILGINATSSYLYVCSSQAGTIGWRIIATTG